MGHPMFVSFHLKNSRPFVVLAACLMIALFSPTVTAEEAQLVPTAELGDCAACHGGDTMVPDGHLSTKGVKLPQCLTCHKEEDPKLTNTMPMSHSHQLSGVGCKGCHGEAAPPEAVPTAKCVECHTLEALVESTQDVEEANPHSSHYGPDLDCEFCHHAHKESENFCLQCHSFDFVVPSPIEKPKKKVTEMKEQAAVPAPAPPPTRCESCHSGMPYTDEFPNSAHGTLCCTSCHINVGEISDHMRGLVKPELTSCASCHREITRTYAMDHHSVIAGLSCLSCHHDIHALKKQGRESKAVVIEQCITCHDRETYVALGHGKSVLEGNNDSAGCSDCHPLHAIPVYDYDDFRDRANARETYTQICKTCHDDQRLALRNDLSPDIFERYEEALHGKLVDMGSGYPERIAGCADCHNGHNILPEDDPRSTINASDLLKDCAQCHEGFHPRFVQYESHPDYTDRKEYAAIYWTNVFMLGLLASVFLFFWTHTALWWRKAYWEKWKMEKSGLTDEMPSDDCEPTQYVRRFSVRDRLMHFFLIISFFTLVMTGFPIKYHDTAWAKALLNVWGGIKYAGMFHRIAAFILIILFLYTCWLSLKFLFPGRRTSGWVGRLFGHDSLCFNLKDWEDLKGTIKWFFNRGELPKYDRWTYWEKFDYFAVFWGMFVIGLSGLMLWMPELMSYILPGWFINVAAVAHSEEAFLAAIFIFTVHFFHNHLVPNKFPMETNIFTGCNTIEVLKKERPLEYERIMKENRLEEIKCKRQSLSLQLVTSLVGFGSVILGLLLTILIFWAIFCY